MNSVQAGAVLFPGGVYVALIDKLKPQWKAFAWAYLGNGFNGTKAARQAQFEGDDATLAVTASRLLRNAKVAAAIDEQMQTLVMSAQEAMFRLSQTARGDLGDFANMTEAELVNHPQSHLLHTIKRRTIPQKNAEPIVELEIKLYDAQAAQIQILKQHQLASGKPTEIVEVNDARDRLARLIARHADGRGAPDDPDGDDPGGS